MLDHILSVAFCVYFVAKYSMIFMVSFHVVFYTREKRLCKFIHIFFAILFSLWCITSLEIYHTFIFEEHSVCYQ